MNGAVTGLDLKDPYGTVRFFRSLIFFSVLPASRVLFVPLAPSTSRRVWLCPRRFPERIACVEGRERHRIGREMNE